MGMSFRVPLRPEDASPGRADEGNGVAKLAKPAKLVVAGVENEELDSGGGGGSGGGGASDVSAERAEAAPPAGAGMVEAGGGTAQAGDQQAGH